MTHERLLRRAAVTFLLAACGFGASAQVGSGGPPDPDAGLAAWVNQYLVAPAMHIDSDIAVRIWDTEFGPEFVTDGTDIAGEFASWWQSDDSYLLDIAVDPAGYPGVDVAFAWDGSMFAEWRRDQGSLAYSANDWNELGIVLRDPIMDLLQFVYPVSDATIMSPTKLSTVQNDGDLATRLAGANWQRVSTSGATAVFPGATVDGVTFVTYADFEWHSNRLVPVKIEHVANTVVVASIVAGGYVTRTHAGVTYTWPTNVVFRGFNEEGTLQAEIEYDLDTLEVASGYPGSTFEIDWLLAESVWSIDEQSFED
ncbi:MAG: hypothetical protein IT439_09925 [Phycisphaerales bacterium]|nr:hypothetical protein [Phycisphaerales bacterium]